MVLRGDGVKAEQQSNGGCCEAGGVLFVAEENLQFLQEKL